MLLKNPRWIGFKFKKMNNIKSRKMKKGFWKNIKNFLLEFKKVFTSNTLYILGIFIFTVTVMIFGIYYTKAQNKVEKIHSNIIYLIEIRGITDSSYSDSQIASVLWKNQTFSKNAYLKYLELARIMNKSPENPKKIDEIKNHSDLEEAIEKNVIYSFRYYLKNLIIQKNLYEDESEIYFKTLLYFQYIVALFSLILATKQINLKER